MVNRRFLGRLTLLLALSLPAQAQVPATAVIGTPPQPGWSQLTAPQKAVLAPLARDWDGLDNIQRRKWLGIVERYPGMKPEEQQRMQERMREWAALTPEQRAKVRGTYKDFKQLPVEQKQVVKQKWEAYTSLPSEERQKIRESGRSAKLLAPPPAPVVELPPPALPPEPAEAPAPEAVRGN
ncbi:MAG: DUF3106 domain-containing protein [Azonexus sp.]|nr:DUF3106 domain-containing protein [Azonexus sp.]MCK6411881.1 DUF3106 domain-containing protein [Azonexus sp.]